VKVEDVMTRTVLTVERDTPLREVAAILSEHGISGLPVVEGDRVVGVVSEADLLVKERGEPPRRTGMFGLFESERPEDEAKLYASTAGEAMTSPALTITGSRPVAAAAALMIEAGVNRLPVVDEQERLVGIVTRADLVRAFVRRDSEIAQEIRDDVALRSLWISPEQLEITVERGVVTLSGRVETRDDAELLPRLARRVPGVVSVESTLTWEHDGRG